MKFDFSNAKYFSEYSCDFKLFFKTREDSTLMFSNVSFPLFQTQPYCVLQRSEGHRSLPLGIGVPHILKAMPFYSLIGNGQRKYVVLI